MAGNKNGKAELMKIYGDDISKVNLDYETILQELESKN